MVTRSNQYCISLGSIFTPLTLYCSAIKIRAIIMEPPQKNIEIFLKKYKDKNNFQVDIEKT